jgi:shikimate kinase
MGKEKMCSVILTGIKHSGKSTLGRLLARQLRVSFYDTDEIITRDTGKTPRGIALSLGEAAFKDAELDACRTLAECCRSVAVIATGGGICNNQKAFDAMKALGKIVFVDVSEDTAYARILASGVPVWILNEHPETPDDARRIFHSVYEERTRRYRAAANLVFAPEDKSAEENAAKLAAAIGGLCGTGATPN